MEQPNTQLIHFDTARKALALASSIDEVKQIRDQAEAIRQYIRQQKGSFEMQNQAAEIKLRAERRAGEMLKEQEKNKGGYAEGVSHDVIPPTYHDLGITAMQSHRWQLEAEIPEEKFEQFINETKAKAEELTSRATLGIALKIRHEQRKQEAGDIELPPGLYSVITIDPPWPYGGSYSYDYHFGRVASPYPEMSMEELMVMDIPAADDCVLWLWVTNAFMHDAYHILESWAFEPKTILTWFKEHIGVGYYLRGETEHCLLATKGQPQVSHDVALTTHLKVKSTNHSSKPNEFYDLIETLCGKARKQTHLEMFARKPRTNWKVWGNEIT